MKVFPFHAITVVLVLAVVLVGCMTDEPGVPAPTSSTSGPLMLQKKAAAPAAVTSGLTGADMLTALNVQLAEQGQACRVLMMEYITSPRSDQVGTTIFSKDVGNKQLSAHWVPFDPNRRGDRYITYAIDHTEGTATGGVTAAQTEASIDHAMGTWNSQTCSTIPIVKVDLGNLDLGYVQYLTGFGGVPGWGADITDAGWLPGAFFDVIATDGSQYILGVTFTFIWTDGGNPTDIDNNGKADVAFREIYYNNAFAWSISGPEWYDPEIDVESIVLHETGHGLSQAHFGKMFVDASDKEPPYSIKHLHFAPRAVMNAVYWDTQRQLLGPDVGGHCSIWASWPN